MSKPSNSISNETLSRIIQIESAGNPKARARTSTACGLAQFITTTWMTVVRRHRPDWLEGRTQKQVLDLRFEPRNAIEMLARFTEENAAVLPGVKDSDGDLYLAHFAGVGVAKRLLQAPIEAPCEHYFSSAAVAANHSILAGKTVGDVRRWAERKMTLAGGRKWVEKYWDEDEKVAAVAPPDDTQPPREIDTEGEWTYDNPPQEKTGTSEAAAAGTALSGGGFLYLLWEKITELPESILSVVVGLASKPSFWFVVIVGLLCAYIYRKRQQAKKEGAA